MSDEAADASGVPGPRARSVPPLRPTALLVGSGSVLLAALGWAVVSVTQGRRAHPALSPHFTMVVAWLIVPVAVLLTAQACRRAGTTPGLRTPGRALWRRLRVTLLIFTVGMAANAVEVWAAPAGRGEPGLIQPDLTEPGLISTACYLVGTIHLIWTLLRLPTGGRRRRELLALALDIGAVVVAAALFPLYLWMRESLYSDQSDPALSIVIALGMEFVAVVLIVKVTVAGSRLVDRAALILLALGVLLGLATGASLPLLGVAQYVDSGQVAAPVGCLLFVFAADRQVRAAGLLAGPDLPRRTILRGFSVIPYVAVAMTDVLLLAVVSTAVGLLSPAGVVTLGGVLLTALVCVRQMAALHENAMLLRSVDRSLAEIHRQERRFRALVQNSTDIVMITDPHGRSQFATPSTFRVLGIDPESIPGLNPISLIHPDDAPGVQAAIGAIGDRPGAQTTLHCRVRHADGSWRTLEITSTNLYHDPDVRGLISNARDVTEGRRYQDQLSHQATHDGLTRLPNRTLFLERTRAALARAQSEPVTVALVDLDDFKTINDRLGHGAGDELLIAVADRLRRCVPAGQVVARLGGDEFAVLLVDFPPDEAAAIAGGLIEAVSAPVPAGGQDLLVQASIGLADARPGDGNTELLRRADVAMYAAKEAGKGRFTRYDNGMDQRSIEHARLGAQLRQALDNGDLHLVYQPIVQLPDGRITGVEALVRWRNAEGQFISPDVFIPVAERSGLIVGLGEWALRTACQQAVRWRSRPGGASIRGVNVNVSARQLREPGFAALVAELLRELGLCPVFLTIEVTETAVFDGGRALDELRALDRLGVRIALDDFGTGHSSLGLLRTCPVDILKVDKSFIDGITGTTEQAAIATSLVEIAKGLGLRAVAEGVESADQAERLHQLGYQYAQGFYFAGPLSVDKIDALLERLERDGVPVIVGGPA